MNPLTNIRNIQKLNEKELELGLIGKKSWHDQYKDSAWIFIGGLPYDLTEGDIVCVFSQYGELVNINLVRDKQSGKSKGYGFICYEDQRSTILAVDNLNGIRLLGRTIRVDHVENYRQPKEHGDEDDLTKHIRVEGIAPKAAESEPVGEIEEVLPLKKKKDKKAKKKKKKEKKKKRDDSSSESESNDDIEQAGAYKDKSKDKFKTGREQEREINRKGSVTNKSEKNESRRIEDLHGFSDEDNRNYNRSKDRSPTERYRERFPVKSERTRSPTRSDRYREKSPVRSDRNRERPPVRNDRYRERSPGNSSDSRPVNYSDKNWHSESRGRYKDDDYKRKEYSDRKRDGYRDDRSAYRRDR